MHLVSNYKWSTIFHSRVFKVHHRLQLTITMVEAEQPPHLSPPPPHFVLVHGISGGAWCWYKIRALLETSGFRVTCVDLTSAGIDTTDPNSVVSFDEYNKPLMDFMAKLSDENNSEKVILVGHSAGGLSLSQAIGKFAGKVRAAVFVAATMLKGGFLTEEDLIDGVPDLSRYGDVYELGFGFGSDSPPTSALIKKEFQRQIIYQMSSVEDCALAAMLLKPGPVLALTSARFVDNHSNTTVDTLPRVYIKTTHDNVIRPEQQEAMIKKWPPSEVYVLDADHSPHFSSPLMLFGVLVKIAASFGNQGSK